MDYFRFCHACEQNAHPNRPDGHPEPIRARYEFLMEAESEKPSSVSDKHVLFSEKCGIEETNG